jgi:hypothetical protein
LFAPSSKFLEGFQDDGNGYVIAFSEKDPSASSLTFRGHVFDVVEAGWLQRIA